MMRIIRISGITVNITACLGIIATLNAQQPAPSDSVLFRVGIPFDTGKLYLQNFFTTPWYSMPGDEKPAGRPVDGDSSKMAGVAVGGLANSFSMEWMRSISRYGEDEPAPFVTYSGTSVALGTASAVAIWGTIAAQSFREHNRIGTYGAAAAAALSAYQGFKLWRHISMKAESGP